MFAHAHSKGSFRPGAAARHMIPRLASITSRANGDKVALVKQFIGHYDIVKCDLLSIGEIVASSGQPETDFADTARRYLASLHRTLAKETKWRNIMPYTPLPKSGLQKLRHLATLPKQQHLFGDLASDIGDIERWLNLPCLSLEFASGLRASMIETLQKEPAKEAGKADLGTSVEKQANSQATTDFQNREAKQQPIREEQARLQDSAPHEVAQQTQAGCELLSQRIKTLEQAAAQQSREKSLLSREAAVATEREKKHSEQNAHYAREIERLHTVVAAEKAKGAAFEAQVTRMLEEASNRTDISLTSSSSSAPITNSTFQSPQGSPATSFGSSSGSSPDNNVNNQSHLFQRNTKIPIVHDSSIPMEDACDISHDTEPFRAFNLRGFGFPSQTPSPHGQPQNQMILSKKLAQTSRWVDVQSGGDVDYHTQPADSG
ncbi:hypothetical protein DDE83_004105 [Stemphylium lycopersici]|uniref:Uncharacterized protein n=1 Tax=Stemphylium lycopersici TaxID=183478 RepID=A0A364N5H1_STELY|nr:hypothetical protein DDE83_004105 [Stemphylium lycopersici]